MLKLLRKRQAKILLALVKLFVKVHASFSLPTDSQLTVSNQL